MKNPTKTCEICGLKNVYDRKKKKWKYRMIDHHIMYDPPIIATLCYKCHVWWHGSGRVWKHPFVINEGKDFGSLRFFYTAIRLYEDKIQRQGYTRFINIKNESIQQ